MGCMMSDQRQILHRTFTDRIPAMHKGTPVALHVPTYTMADLWRDYPTGQIRCGSCSALLDLHNILHKTADRWGLNAVITLALSHDYFPVGSYSSEQTPVGHAKSSADGAVLYSDGVREEYAKIEDGRYERLYGVVFRDARSPELVCREVWYPTGDFCAAREEEIA